MKCYSRANVLKGTRWGHQGALCYTVTFTNMYFLRSRAYKFVFSHLQ